LEFEFFLPALLGGSRSRVALCCPIAKDSGAKLFVYENSSLQRRRALPECRLENFVDYLLSGSNLPSLGPRKRTIPAEHFRFKRAAVVEGKKVQRPIKPGRFHDVTLICDSSGSDCLSNCRV